MRMGFHVVVCDLRLVERIGHTRTLSPAACALVHRKSLQRLGISKLGLYMIHWPGFITNGWCNDAFVEGLADCQQQGLTQAVGVSNFKLERVKTAQQILRVSIPCLTPS